LQTPFLGRDKSLVGLRLIYYTPPPSKLNSKKPRKTIDSNVDERGITQSLKAIRKKLEDLRRA
jgi:hypothetical protein